MVIASTLLRMVLSGEMKAVLKLHNVYRCMHGVQDLTWDEKLADNAAVWAENGVFEHSKMPSRVINGTQCGENLAFGSPTMTGWKATSGWYKEIEFTKPYGTAENSHDTTVRGQMIGHYTQIVWKWTTTLGCAKGRTTLQGPDGRSHDGDFWVCQYGEMGNFKGKYAENVLAPIKSVEECGGKASDVPDKSAAEGGLKMSDTKAKGDLDFEASDVPQEVGTAKHHCPHL